MLELRNIFKDYYVGGVAVPALNGIDLSFRENEFVSILGPSGCGKTTMLNIIGGLDRYTKGDLLVNGKSTKDFTDSEWDAYRNTTIGFVFQSYNLISHLSVLDNVEMALRLSGIGATERRQRATKVLTEVGLELHLHKRPNQLSGGQMQRVAIARALVNNPKILLADEPTGAIDSTTSAQIMDLIKVISKGRLVIMVTHNGEIAERYSDRIVKLLDGRVTDDSNPLVAEKEKENQEKLVTKRTTMSYATALKTSYNNLLTKKGRTLITSLAGSIGIIGIALVLSISDGMTSYVNATQSDTLAGFPITINRDVRTDFFTQRQQAGMDALNSSNPLEYPSEDVIFSYNSTTNTITHTNIFDEEFLAKIQAMDPTYYNSISYSHGITLNIVGQDYLGSYQKIETSTGGGFFGTSVFSEMPDSPEFIQSQYDILYGAYPNELGEIVLIVDEQNRLDTSFLTEIGANPADQYLFEDFIGKTFNVIDNDVYYSYNSMISAYVPGNNYQTMYESADTTQLTVVGVMRVKADASNAILDEGFGYTTMLTQHLLDHASDSLVVLDQIANPETNQLTGQPFIGSPISYRDVIQTIGGDYTPTGIQIYPVSFDSKESIKNYIDEYNALQTNDADIIIYTDLAETISKTISELINTITIILSAFAGISLVVSSIMIGIITYVSVIERTKEIGIMRSLGARKRDISRIFNAETVLIGLAAGTLGVIIALVLNFPINAIIGYYIHVTGFAFLSITNAIILVVLSTALTLVAGLVPSQIAARKDPVVALRTE